MGYLSCRAESSIATCRSISSLSLTPQPSHKTSHHHQARKKKKSKDPAASNEEAEDDDGDADPTANRRIRHFSYSELESATRNFSDDALLGRGSHGAVYKAVLRGGRSVAVKRPSRRPTHARDEVENEINILSRIRNPRVVNLIGFTLPSSSSSSHPTGKRERLLVVEFMPNGTLYDLLHTNPRPPGWARRLRLALQTARALLVLHSADPPVIHRDVKSANILLDHRFNARLGDFGLALRDDGDSAPGFRSTPPAGTLGYLDPCYVTPDNLSTKTDVFSFGILLLEIMSGRKAIDVAHSPPSVVEWAVPLIRKGKVSALFDPRISPPRDPVARRHLASLATCCVRSCNERRPSMEEVVEQLKALSKTVPARAWNGIAVGNPCSVVDTERTLLRLNPNSLISDPRCLVVDETSAAEEEAPITAEQPLPPLAKPAQHLKNPSPVFSDVGMRDSRNLKELMARLDEDPVGVLGIGVGGSQRSSISRARTLHITRNYYDKDGMLRLWRNRTIKGEIFGTRLRLNGLENLGGKLHEQAGDIT